MNRVHSGIAQALTKELQSMESASQYTGIVAKTDSRKQVMGVKVLSLMKNK